MGPNNYSASLISKKARPLQVSAAPMPTPKPNEMVIRVHAVAINPADVLVQKLGIVYDTFPVILGSNASGTIVSIGSEVTNFKEGDRVTAFVVEGAFQHYAAVSATFAARLPDNVTFEEACVLPLALVTSSVCMFEKDMLALRLPTEPKAEEKGKLVFIWGGSSALGSCGIQMARAAGYDVACTASPHNAAYCKRLGAGWVFDHKDPDIVAKVVEELKGKVCAGVHCTIFADGVVEKSAQIADALGGGCGGRKAVSVVYPPGVPIPGTIPEGVEICRSELIPQPPNYINLD